tara:strand:+ start:7248 stop:7511 length:264 start_codon:yes stop_codon:yes gene_type:complete
VGHHRSSARILPVVIVIFIGTLLLVNPIDLRVHLGPRLELRDGAKETRERVGVGAPSLVVVIAVACPVAKPAKVLHPCGHVAVCPPE